MLAEARRRVVVPGGDDVHERTHPLCAPLNAVEIVAAEQVLHRAGPERHVFGMVPAGDVRRPVVHVSRHHFAVIGDDPAHGRRLEDARVDLHAALARRLDELREQIAAGVFVAGVDGLVPKRRVLVILVVRADPDERKPASGVVGQRHAVVRAIAQRLHQRGVVGVAVRHHGIDRGRLRDEVERARDAFVQDRVRSHLDAVEPAGGGNRLGRQRRRPEAARGSCQCHYGWHSLDKQPPVDASARTGLVESLSHGSPLVRKEWLRLVGNCAIVCRDQRGGEAVRAGLR